MNPTKIEDHQSAIVLGSSEKKASLPLVSVVIPFFNDYKYLNETLQSCLNNTYAVLEIVIVDDCSVVPLRLEDLEINAAKYSVTIIRNEVNRGPGYSRNRGIGVAKGEYIAFLDADDLWLPDIVENQIKIFLNDPQVVWVYTDGHYLVDGQLHRRPNSYYHGFPGGKFPSGKDVNEFHLKGFNYLTFSSNMFKKRALMDAGLFDERLSVSEDWDLFVRMAEKFPDGVRAINKSLMIYRVNNKGRHFVNRKDYVSVNVQILENMYRRQGLFPAQKNKFDRAVALIYQRAGIQRLNAARNKESREFLFHPQSRPLNWNFRMFCLRVLSFLPNGFYKLALKIFECL